MSAGESIVAAFQHTLGHTGEEFKMWKAVPRNVRLAEALQNRGCSQVFPNLS